MASKNITHGWYCGGSGKPGLAGAGDRNEPYVSLQLGSLSTGGLAHSSSGHKEKVWQQTEHDIRPELQHPLYASPDCPHSRRGTVDTVPEAFCSHLGQA